MSAQTSRELGSSGRCEHGAVSTMLSAEVLFASVDELNGYCLGQNCLTFGSELSDGSL